MHSNLPSVAAAGRSSHASRARANKNWCLHGACDACDLQAAAAANGRFDRIFAQRLKTLHKDAVESTVHRRNGSQIALARSTRAP
eukprot:4336243-Lingulodinium_polyedra.AAC.1